MVSVTINGRAMCFAEEPLIRDVLEALEVPAAAVAVEVNRVIVPRSAHGEERLRSGDQVEVVTFVGGG
jgi:sulfur carrier protein